MQGNLVRFGADGAKKVGEIGSRSRVEIEFFVWCLVCFLIFKDENDVSILKC